MLFLPREEGRVFFQLAEKGQGLVEYEIATLILWIIIVIIAALLGMEWPEGQPSDVATSIFDAEVNGANGTRTAAFLGRPVSSTDWSVIVFAGAPEIGLPDMDLQQLEDIELIFDSTRASRNPGVPDPAECIRIDY